MVYKGGLITFRLKDKKELLCKPLSDIELKEEAEGFLLINRKTKEEYGYICDFFGITEEELFTAFGYSKHD